MYFTLNITGTILWNKEKEEGYAKMCQEEAKKKDYIVIHYKTWIPTVYPPAHYKTWIPTVYPPVHSQIWHNESRNHFALWKGR